MVDLRGGVGVCHDVPNVTPQLHLCMVDVVKPVYLGWTHPVLHLRKVQSIFSVAHDAQHLNMCI